MCIVEFVKERGDTRQVKVEAAELFKCSLGSIQKIMNTYYQNGRTKPIWSGGVQKTFKKGDRMSIRNTCVSDPFLTNGMIAHRYFLLTGKAVSRTTVTRILNSFELNSRVAA